MPVELRSFTLDVPKLFPLTISRGTSGTTRNLFIELADGRRTGIGEAAPPTGTPPDYAESAHDALDHWAQLVDHLPDEELRAEVGRSAVESIVRAAFDCALWDLRSKQAGQPLYRFLGLTLPAQPTSVTIGIEPPEVARERIPQILELTGARALKVKLGSPEGRDHDRELWATAVEASHRFGVRLRADANGGWSPEEAIDLIAWLSERGCEYVEQPLERGREEELIAVFRNRKLPIFLDESIRTAGDVAQFADRCDGVNLKLMKSGGITEGIAVLRLADRHGLQTMIGSMCETAVGVAQSAALSGACHHIDLDTHLNHAPDPAGGIDFIDGIVMPRDVPGHGGFVLPEFRPK